MNDAANAAEAWYDSQGYLAATVNDRLALQIGREIIERTAQQVRAEMAEGKAQATGAQVEEIARQVDGLRQQIAAQPAAGAADANAERLARALQDVPIKNLPAWFVSGAPTPPPIEPTPATHDASVTTDPVPAEAAP